ncbi:putative MarR-family transcriptional regulator [Frankia canadensis]|uniref:Putative MarR-family transcriptional regulator n=1 Tax=Frankia canadensis TaxID=1836972 RepID=A0A2I2L071_9ACTN|nr:MarR family transcriptional regulator [Frankia canadensis]SNQ51313.1 putative MarR-family transcriptional regulator [Frankia canadensis]SOU58603.1 putative MarR-family transcriptional regulator [Frankia canadensis]
MATSREESAAAARRAVTHLGRRLRAERPAGALNGTKLTVLSHLYRLGPSTPKDIATAARHQPQSLSRTFAELQEAGLISRRPGEHDRRAAVLTITEVGRDALVRDMAHRDAWLARALDALTDAEVDLIRIAATLLDQIAESPSDQDQRADQAKTTVR